MRISRSGLKNISKLQGYMVDALAPEVEEGRGKLRKAAGRSKHLMNRGYPNRETVLGTT